MTATGTTSSPPTWPGPHKPPFTYFGGKTTLAEAIVRLLPEHDHYVEPFAGSLAVLLAKRPKQFETVNDLDADLVTFWRVLRDRPDDLTRAALLTPHARAEFEASADLDVTDEVERARRVWVRLTQSRGQSMKPTGWKYNQNPAGRPMPWTANILTFAGRFGPVAVRLRGVQLECRDALEVIRDYGQHPSVCIYADPPYLGSVRVGERYGVEMTGDNRHEELARALRNCKAAVVLSGYASPLYEELYDGWHRVEMKGPPGLSGATDRVEVLWMNRPPTNVIPSLFEEGS